jgi:hypothetical protein
LGSKSPTVPAGAKLDLNLATWVKVSIADAVVVFGRLEQEISEIAWILTNAVTVADRVKLAKNAASGNFLDVVGSVEEVAGQAFDGLRTTFIELSNDRNLIVHGSWLMVDDRPLVMWHKFIEDTDGVMGEYYDKGRFEKFMLKANALLDMCRKFHNELEQSTGVKTSALGAISNQSSR